MSDVLPHHSCADVRTEHGDSFVPTCLALNRRLHDSVSYVTCVARTVAEYDTIEALRTLPSKV